MRALFYKFLDQLIGDFYMGVVLDQGRSSETLNKAGVGVPIIQF